LLRAAGSIKIVGEAATTRRALHLMERVHPDVVLMDTFTPDLGGDEATEKIKALDPHVQVLILSLDTDEPMVSRCLRAGAAGYVRNDNQPPQLRDAIDTAFRRCAPRRAPLPKRRRTAPGKAAAILFGLGLCFGQTMQAQDYQNGFFLTSPLGLSSGWDQNFINGDQQLNDTESLLNGPTFAWMKSTHTTQFSIDYQPEFEFFAKNPNLDAWNHTSRLRFVHRMSGRVDIEMGNYFVSTNDPTRVLANSLLLLPLGRFEQNSFYTALNYRLDHRTKLTFRAENSFTSTNGILGPLAGRLDDAGVAGTVSLEHKFGDSQLVTGSYSFLHVEPLSSLVQNGASSVNLLNLGDDYTIRPDLVLHLSIGSVQAAQDAMLGAAALEKRIGNVWLAGGYQRYVAFFGGFTSLAVVAPGVAGFPQGLVPSNVYQVATLRGWGQVSKRVGIDMGAQRGLTGVNLLGQNIHGAIFHARLDYRINDRLVWFARAEYYDENAPEFVPFAGARRRYTSGIEIALMRPPESLSGRNARGPLAPEDDQPVPGFGVPQE